MKLPKIKGAWKKSRNLRNKGDNLHAQSCKLYDKGSRFRSKSYKLYQVAVVLAYGPKAIIDWKTGEIEVEE